MRRRNNGAWKAVRHSLAALVLLLAVANTGYADEVLRFVPQADLKNTDPIWTTAAITLTHGFMIYDQLFAQDWDFKMQPQMVDTWETSSDGLTYTFNLRDGLMFHDSDTVKSGDAVASIKRWGQRDIMAQKLMALVESVNIVNDKTFNIKLKQPYGLVIESLGKPSSNVLLIYKEETAGTTDGFTQIKTNIGSGPFRMVESEWVPGNKVVYESFDGYKPRSEPASQYAGGKVARVKRVEWIYIPDQATALAALRAGEVDYHEKPETDYIPILESDADIVVVPIPLRYQGFMALNHKWPPFDNIKARRAMQYMVKQIDYVQSIIGDPKYYMEYCGSMYMCDMPPYTTTVGDEPVKAHDVAMAKKLLKESGYDGYPVVLMDPTDFPVLHGAALVTAQKMREIGFNVDLQAMDWSTLTSRRAEKKSPKEGGWNVFHTWWTHPNLLTPVGHPGMSGNCDEGWFGWACDEEMKKLSSGWALEPDSGKQMEIANNLHKRSMEYVPYVPFGQWQRPLAYRKSLKNLLVTPTSVFWNVSKSE